MSFESNTEIGRISVMKGFVLLLLPLLLLPYYLVLERDFARLGSVNKRFLTAQRAAKLHEIEVEGTKENVACSQALWISFVKPYQLQG